ncbi:hypothetical protein FHR81_001542 [Actinoalloteichus hoggarensis]|uniref:Uncharacterized protein n=1 Tax=Actinoalloteichus hoggarensis TaxID=1470176 RepID=A0A221W0I7_9PSEU|nr:ACT domain-containing protein [Actinoalloteichus hoggarensis]ASO19274.1 hypothetical protein AHOG_08145 [Actinoalloteichus hoggarensis]MBB5920512.1 hypothetical protein [Actinoalloteichus hoggarensis]
MELDVLAGEYAICRLDAAEALPDWLGPRDGSRLCSVTWAGTELSVVCPVEQVPVGADGPDVRVTAGWLALRVRGPLDFSLIGVLASLVEPLREAGVSVLSVSTFETDYLLVPAADRLIALTALREGGHSVAEG